MHYKKRQTLKAFVAVTSKGKICYTSKLFSGSTLDKMLFEELEPANLQNPRDIILVDKEFFIHDQGVILNILPFAVKPRFTPEKSRCTTQFN